MVIENFEEKKSNEIEINVRCGNEMINRRKRAFNRRTTSECSENEDPNFFTENFEIET